MEDVATSSLLSVQEKEQQGAEMTRSWADLPKDLLERIVSQFSLDGNILFSAVCKRWQSVALPLRRLQSPLLMSFSRISLGKCTFFDPSDGNSYERCIPYLKTKTIRYSKHGWLLVCNSASGENSLFNPFSCERVELPFSYLDARIVAFSSEPTSPSCIVIGVKTFVEGYIIVMTCRPGAKEWRSHFFRDKVQFRMAWISPVFCDGLFYCLDENGRLGVYDPKLNTWTVISPPVNDLPEEVMPKYCWSFQYLVESRGKLLMVVLFYPDEPIILELDRSKNVWTSVKSLDNRTLFLSPSASISTSCVPGIKPDCVYSHRITNFSDEVYMKGCLHYSLDQGRYHPGDNCYGRVDPHNMWIQPPHEAPPPWLAGKSY
ncbi:PREDICTED: F-box/kelch-repeat protein At1g57790-like [Nelumbo nucifera]|uniref:F-box/kelch-repeat protein At1g57790-like n=2 Tax=Nelumbo nucifera TaxID=4432 RepID=A0A822YAI5_NELNU|nr:PREDICTED: F-box/kelch-repeat protein At1g57790-like [Nelumbo nucifera]DAD28116.1 TPA_asm: hypothetical protein HUJ06_029584 [Nelumbo nucifera]